MAKIEITPEEEKLLKEIYENDSLMRTYSSNDNTEFYIVYDEFGDNGFMRKPIKTAKVSKSFFDLAPYISNKIKENYFKKEYDHFRNLTKEFEQENEGVPEWLKTA